MNKVLEQIPTGLDFVLGPPTFSKPDWTTRHTFVSADDKPETCGYEEGGIECRWPEESEFHLHDRE